MYHKSNQQVAYLILWGPWAFSISPTQLILKPSHLSNLTTNLHITRFLFFFLVPQGVDWICYGSIWGTQIAIGEDPPFSSSSFFSSSIAVSSAVSVASFAVLLSLTILFMIYISSSSMVGVDGDKPWSGGCSHCGSTTVSSLTSWHSATMPFLTGLLWIPFNNSSVICWNISKKFWHWAHVIGFLYFCGSRHRFKGSRALFCKVYSLLIQVESCVDWTTQWNIDG